MKTKISMFYRSGNLIVEYRTVDTLEKAKPKMIQILKKVAFDEKDLLTPKQIREQKLEDKLDTRKIPNMSFYFMVKERVNIPSLGHPYDTIGVKVEELN